MPLFANLIFRNGRFFVSELSQKRQNAVAAVSSSEAEISETEPEVCGAFM